MTEIANSAYSDGQILAWLRGLYTVALADGHYDPKEQALISQLTQDAAKLESDQSFETISPTELASQLGSDRDTAENFLRTAVLVAVADGVYSTSEYELLHEFSAALNVEVSALAQLENTLYKPEKIESSANKAVFAKSNADILHPVKDWLDELDIKDPRLANFICKVIPSQCPFERDINLFGRTIAHIPPLCKLNPLYEQFVGLRFRSLSYLADGCGQDISEYI